MAHVSLVLNDVLCFLVNKFGKLAVKSLKVTLTDFYSVDASSWGEDSVDKRCRLDEIVVEASVYSAATRHEARLAREVDDIISLFTFVDENKAMNLLPKYVSSSPDNMPSLRLYDGDLNVILSWMKNIGTRIERFEEVMAAICRDVKELQVRSCDQLVQSTRTATRGSVTALIVNKPTPVVSTEPLPTDGNSFAHVVII